jgi:hypothetical protein
MHYQNGRLCWPLPQTGSCKFQNKLTLFVYTKVFSFPTFHLQRGGVKHCHRGKGTRDGVQLYTHRIWFFARFLRFFSRSGHFICRWWTLLGCVILVFNPLTKLNYYFYPYLEHVENVLSFKINAQIKLILWNVTQNFALPTNDHYNILVWPPLF